MFQEPRVSQTINFLNVDVTKKLDDFQKIETNSLFKENAIFDLNFVSVDNLSTRASTKAVKNLTNYPVVSQGSYPICWAGVIASIIIYEQPQKYNTSNTTALSVCEWSSHPIAGASTVDACRYMKNLMPSVYKPTFYDRSLNTSEISTIINNNDPAYIAAWVSSGDSGHVVALCGYTQYLGGYAVRIMNPGTGTFEAMNINGSNSSFSYNGKAYYWKQSIRLLY